MNGRKSTQTKKFVNRVIFVLFVYYCSFLNSYLEFELFLYFRFLFNLIDITLALFQLTKMFYQFDVFVGGRCAVL